MIFLLFIQNLDLLSAPAPMELLLMEVTRYSTLPSLMTCPTAKWMKRYLVCSPCFRCSYSWGSGRWGRLLPRGWLGTRSFPMRWGPLVLDSWCVLRWKTLVCIFCFILWDGSTRATAGGFPCWAPIWRARRRILPRLGRKRGTRVVPVNVDEFGSQCKFERILDYVLVELVVEQRVRIFLPGDCLQR